MQPTNVQVDKPTIATNPDGTSVIQVPSTKIYTKEQVEQKIADLTLNRDTMQHEVDNSIALNDEITLWQSYLAQFPADPQPLPVNQVSA